MSFSMARSTQASLHQFSEIGALKYLTGCRQGIIHISRTERRPPLSRQGKIHNRLHLQSRGRPCCSVGSRQRYCRAAQLALIHCSVCRPLRPRQTAGDWGLVSACLHRELYHRSRHNEDCFGNCHRRGCRRPDRRHRYLNWTALRFQRSLCVGPRSERFFVLDRGIQLRCFWLSIRARPWCPQSSCRSMAGWGRPWRAARWPSKPSCSSTSSSLTLEGPRSALLHLEGLASACTIPWGPCHLTCWSARPWEG